MVGELQPRTEIPRNGLATWPCLLDVLVHEQAKKKKEEIAEKILSGKKYGAISLHLKHVYLKFCIAYIALTKSNTLPWQSRMQNLK